MIVAAVTASRVRTGFVFTLFVGYHQKRDVLGRLMLRNSLVNLEKMHMGGRLLFYKRLHWE